MDALFEEGLNLIDDARKQTSGDIISVTILSKGLELYHAGIEKVRVNIEEDSCRLR